MRISLFAVPVFQSPNHGLAEHVPPAVTPQQAWKRAKAGGKKRGKNRKTGCSDCRDADCRRSAGPLDTSRDAGSIWDQRAGQIINSRHVSGGPAMVTVHAASYECPPSTLILTATVPLSRPSPALREASRPRTADLTRVWVEKGPRMGGSVKGAARRASGTFLEPHRDGATSSALGRANVP